MKSRIALLVVTLALIFGFQNNKLAGDPIIKKGMIKVTILYPNGEGKKFDMDYYSSKHIPMVQSLFGTTMKGASIDKGLAGGSATSPVPYLAIGYLYFENVAAFQDGMKINGEKIRGDVPNYTNTTPVIQISEVIQ